MTKIINLIIIAIVLLPFLLGCGPTRVVRVDTNDSLKVTLRTEIVWRDSTVWVDVPEFDLRNDTRDTTSTLRAFFAESTASITDGVLFHSLRSISGIWGVNIKVPTLRRDSVVYRNFRTTDVVEVDRDFTTGERLFMTLGKIFVGVIFGFLTYYIIRKKLLLF